MNEFRGSDTGGGGGLSRSPGDHTAEHVVSRPARHRPHLVFVVNTDWFFLSHRLPLAQEAIRRGWRVTLAAPDTGRADEIRAQGIEVIDLPLSRSGTNPVREIGTVQHLARLYRQLRPSLIHHVTPKPVVYGSLAARAVPGTPVVNAVSGLGYAFIGKAWWHPLPVVVRTLYRLALRRPGSWTIFQNDDDLGQLSGAGLVEADRAVLIRGSGVDIERFTASPEPEGVPIVLLPARVLRDKGVGEFVEAARALRARGLDVRFVLAGPLDPGNPAGVSRDTVEGWVAEGAVEWWGNQDDMPSVYRQATVVALPSYREGLPKALLEAGATARTLVTTDVPGCRDVVTDGVTGRVVPVRDAAALADAIEAVLADPGLRERLRMAARDDVEERYAVEHIVAAHFALYERALALGASDD